MSLSSQAHPHSVFSHASSASNDKRLVLSSFATFLRLALFFPPLPFCAEFVLELLIDSSLARLLNFSLPEASTYSRCDSRSPCNPVVPLQSSCPCRKWQYHKVVLSESNMTHANIDHHACLHSRKTTCRLLSMGGLRVSVEPIKQFLSLCISRQKPGYVP